MRKQRGVTLIELVVVIIIIGILAAVAIPSYRQYVVRSQRIDAKAALLALATAQEKYYTQCNTYAPTLSDVSSCADGEIAFPSTSEKGMYALTITAANDAGFTVRAVPSSGSPQATDSECTWFQINDRGVKTSSSPACWDQTAPAGT